VARQAALIRELPSGVIRYRFSGHLSTQERAGDSLQWLLSLLINYDEILVFVVGEKEC
jgi:hypothetical protein